jgi:hypothetical protein
MVQPKCNVFKPTSYKDLDEDPVISKRTHSIDYSDTGEEDTVSKRMDEAEYSPSDRDDKEEDNEDELESYDNDDELERLRLLRRPWLILVHQLEIAPSQQYYLHQKKYDAFLQVLLSDTMRFLGFPQGFRWNGHC